MKKRKLIFLMLSLICAFALTACNNEHIIGPQGPQGETGERGEDGVSIVSVDLTSSDGLVDIYTITYSDGTTSNFIVTNGKNGEQGIQGIPGQDGHTPVITISSDGYWVIDGVKTNTKAQGEQGEPGKDGTSLLTGNGEPSANLGKNGDSYIDLDTWDFYVKTSGTWIHTGNIKGEQGNQGNDGIDGLDGTAVLTGEGEPSVGTGKNGDSYIDLSTWNYYVKENDEWVLKGNIKGTDGTDGEDGNGIVSIELTSSSGNVDTYTITYDNGDTTTFTITNGVDGEQGIQGEPGEDGHTPVITIGENGNWYIDGEDTGVLAEGVQGPQGEPGEDGVDGEDGLSAYEIYIKYHPEYEGTEEEWLEDLVNGDLREEYKITFQTNGGSTIEPQYVKYGRLVTRPPDDPTRTGYLFDGWYLGAELFPFNSYQVYDDLTLLAHWKSMNINLTLDANGGDVEYNTKTVTYGVDYVLPTPTRANYTFDGWYLDDTLLCPMTGVWTFSKVDITLKARWAGTQAEITFASDENIQVDSSPITLTYGNDFTLPVPTILTGDRFIGWADASGELVTDENGQSLKPSEFKTNTELHAVYYVPVTTPNQLLNLCTAEENDERLTRTYVLQNDLDFTGLANESISNFKGVLDGQEYNIIGLEEPLFNYISDSTVRNINLLNFSGNTFIAKASGNVLLNNITIDSFIKDESNQCNFDGIVGKVECSNFKMEQCHINDEFATVNSGLIDIVDFNFSSNIDISYCTVHSNTLNHAFFSSNKTWSYTSDFGGFDDSNIVATDNDCLTNISYCSNFGDSQYLIDCFVGSQRYYSYFWSNGANKVYDDIDVIIDNYEVFVTNCVNYGKVNILLNNDGLVKKVLEHNSNSTKYIDPIYGFIMVRQFLNFGEIDSFGVNYSAQCSFNCGLTNDETLESGTNNYNFTPVTSAVGGAFSITNYSQINSDFFINTIGLDPERWNLSYINIQDEYGLPTIIYE